jgi:ring-1,2-phenylacetyl-CoA epoxidase subunit PaaC
MTSDQKKIEYILRIADNTLILGQRLSEWCGHGPVLEEDIALSNISLDYFGQATHLLKYAAEIEGKGRDEDDFAFLRDDIEFRNLLMVELPNGDYAFTIARQFFFSAWYQLYLEKLCQSKDEYFQGFAAKSLKEVKYHLQHASDWVIRMGDGTDESKQRIKKAVSDINDFLPEFFMTDELDEWARVEGIITDITSLKEDWNKLVLDVFTVAGLELPAAGWGQRGGKMGRHTEHLGFILAEMQHLQRSYPGAKW